MIDKMTKMADVLKMHPEALSVLKGLGLNCGECSGAKHESVQQGAINHGLDVNELLQKLNALFPEDQN
jgi:hybrid cluster-associated redox disulfide protein